MESLTPLTVEEVYTLSNGGDKNYGIEGYTVAKTVQYYERDFKIPTGKTKDMYYEASKRAKDPGPTHYAETPEENLRRHWTTSGGKFSGSQRKSMIDELTAQTKAVPGPGSYFKKEKGKKEDRTKDLPLGRLP